MVFSSIPPYDLDPSNWHHQQQQQNHQIIGSSGANPLPPPPPHGSGSGSIRPGSMSERARMANIPLPETALKCPRCESTNTKFCYFNNYSFSQPRHFCKTCRRYWTRGGALRNVPVGGGCRRNKRSTKSSSSKSSPASSERHGNPNPSSSTDAQPQLPPPRFVSPLSQLSDNYASEFGLSYGGVTAAPPVGSNEMSFHGGIEAWRMQQFPFLGGLDSSSAGMYGAQFHHGGESGFMGGETSHHDVRPPKVSSSMLSQMAAVKTEGRHPERQLLGGGMAGNEQWNPLTVNWTELSSFSSSSTSNNNPL